MIISNCRNCNSNTLKKIFSLGNLYFTGKFPAKKNNKVLKGYINIVLCNKCKLVQLDRSFKREMLYGKDYGYRTGINKTMTDHVGSVVATLQKKIKLNPKDYVLDIASNDATLLNFYPKNINKVGIDPTAKKYKKYYKNINYYFPNFFSSKIINDRLPKVKFKLITVLSMFYDLEKPNSFLKEVKNILHKKGILLIQHADLLSILKKNMFDTFCHEHLEYYSSKVIIEMVKKNGMRVFDHKFNNINGGSSQYFICHEDASHKESRAIKSVLKIEEKYKLESVNTHINFFKKINEIKINLKKIINDYFNKNKVVHGYGASTKGNVLLQYFGFNNSLIPYIADRNPEKYNKFTPGTKIKIISEEKSRNLKPDYYLVLPWHFKKEILLREKIIASKGTKFIFPMPKITVK